MKSLICLVDEKTLSHVERESLLTGIKIFFILAILSVAFVLTDFSFNQPVPKSYQFRLSELVLNSPVLLKQGSLIIVIARYDRSSISKIQAEFLSSRSKRFQDQQIPVLKQGYYVAMGYGTLAGCPIEIQETFFKESCSTAKYDLLGRSLNKQHFPDLKVPQYNFNRDFSLLTIE